MGLIPIQNRVVIKCSETVIPAKPTSQQPAPIHHYSLSNLDLMFSTYVIYDPNVYYFSPLASNNTGVSEETSALQFEDVFKSLKESLAKVLVLFPVLAGRVKSDDHGRRMYIECNDEGVLLVGAMADARFDEWKHLKDCPLEPFLNLSSSHITDYVCCNPPLLRLQVTVFRCGGVAIGYGWSHICMDGWSATDFIRSWAEVHRGLPALTLNPNFDTSVIKPRNPPHVDQPVKDYRFTEKTPHDLDHLTTEDAASTKVKLAVSMIYFSSTSVDAMIEEVRKGPWGYEIPSVHEALTAICWKAMTEARDLADDDSTAFCYPINVRLRWNPPLPEGFMGNGVHLSCLKANAGDIKGKHVSYLAKLIKNDGENVGSEYLRSVVDLIQMEMVDSDKVIGFNAEFDGGRDLQGSDFASFPVYDVDFGSGKPLYFALTLNPIFGNGIVVTLPTAEGGNSRYVALSMELEHMERLLQNKMFASFLGKSEDEPEIHLL